MSDSVSQCEAKPKVVKLGEEAGAEEERGAVSQSVSQWEGGLCRAQSGN